MPYEHKANALTALRQEIETCFKYRKSELMRKYCKEYIATYKYILNNE
jgi:hypothetical protein